MDLVKPPRGGWIPWLFNVPKDFWTDKKNHLLYLEWLARKLGFKNVEEWYRIKAKHFLENKGGALLGDYYNNSPIKAVRENFPEYDWDILKFKNVNLNYWKDLNNQKEYMKKLGHILDYTKAEDWYQVTKRDFQNNRGHTLLSYYHDSPSKIVMELVPIPIEGWDKERFKHFRKSLWKTPKFREESMRGLQKLLKCKKFEDWYEIKKQDFIKNHKTGLIMYYKGSVYRCVKELFPSFDWKPWLFKYACPQRFWSSEENKRIYMDWLSNKLGYKQPSDWYGIKQKDFYRNKGNRLLKCYGGSPSKAVMAYLPEYDWKIWFFGDAPKNYWRKRSNRREYVKWLGDKLNFTKISDWYKIRKEDFERNKGVGLLKYCHRSPAFAVMECFPNYAWEPEKFSEKRKAQKQLYRFIKQLFPRLNVLWNYKHPGLRFKKTRAPMELDIFIPDLRLAIEYQGQQHFMAIKSWGGEDSFKKLSKRDFEKRTTCKKLGIKLVIISYMWDGTVESLKRLLKNQTQYYGVRFDTNSE